MRAAMPGFIAKKLCPSLVIVSCHFDKYVAASDAVREILATYDPDFSAVSLDEAYLDFTDHLTDRSTYTADQRTFPRAEHEDQSGSETDQTDQGTFRQKEDKDQSGHKTDQGTFRQKEDKDQSGHKTDQGTFRQKEDKDESGHKTDQGTFRQKEDKDQSGHKTDQGTFPEADPKDQSSTAVNRRTFPEEIPSSNPAANNSKQPDDVDQQGIKLYIFI